CFLPCIPHPPPPPPSPPRRSSDLLAHARRAPLRSRRVALLAHQASFDSRHTHAATLLGDLRGARLVRLLAPEHGLWGARQDHERSEERRVGKECRSRGAAECCERE